PHGPAGLCFRCVESAQVILVISPFVIAEVRALPEHSDLRRFKTLTRHAVDRFLIELLRYARLEEDIPSAFAYDRDPDDAHYVNLALKAGATMIVSRDKDLL